MFARHAESLAAPMPERPACPPPTPHADGATRTIRSAQLNARTGQGLQLIAPRAAAEDDNPPLMSGRFAVSRLREGLYLHCTDIEHLRDMHTRFETRDGGLKIMLKLEGSADVRFGSKPLGLDAGQGRDAQPCGAVLALARPENFERRARGGTRERMVVITLTPAWLEASQLDELQRRAHLELSPWRPSSRAIALAEQLIRPDAYSGHLLALFQESRTLELVGEALARTANRDETLPADLRPTELRRVVRLRTLLESGELDQFTMSDIAQELGCNANTLQQQFRQTFGKTIFDYQRECRLQRAAEALERHGISVAQAAEIAGYSSQANFSTAFRRRFSLTPKQFRARV